MPQLKKSAVLQKFWLPSTDNSTDENDKAWVEIDLGKVVIGDIVNNYDDDSSNAKNGLAILTSKITSWNYTEDDGTITPINIDSVSKLDVEDFKFLVEKMDIDKRIGETKGLADDPKGN